MKEQAHPHFSGITSAVVLCALGMTLVGCSTPEVQDPAPSPSATTNAATDSVRQDIEIQLEEGPINFYTWTTQPEIYVSTGWPKQLKLVNIDGTLCAQIVPEDSFPDALNVALVLPPNSRLDGDTLYIGDTEDKWVVNQMHPTPRNVAEHLYVDIPELKLVRKSCGNAQRLLIVD